MAGGLGQGQRGDVVARVGLRQHDQGLPDQRFGASRIALGHGVRLGRQLGSLRSLLVLVLDLVVEVRPCRSERRDPGVRLRIVGRVGVSRDRKSEAGGKGDDEALHGAPFGSASGQARSAPWSRAAAIRGSLQRDCGANAMAVAARSPQ